MANHNRSAVLSELIKLRQSIPNLSLNVMEGRGNSTGAHLAGMLPDRGPIGEKISRPGLNALQVLESASKSGWDLLYVAGADPAVKFSGKLWNQARAKLGFLVVQDLFLTETAKKADVVLPALSFMEKRGAFINIEGRVQYIQPSKKIPEDVLSDAEIFTAIAHNLNLRLGIDSKFLDVISQDRIQLNKYDPIQSSQNSIQKAEGLLATLAPALFDNGVRMKHNPHLIQLAKHPFVRLHPEECSKRNIRDGDIMKLKTYGNAIAAKIKLDTRVAVGTIVLPLGFDEFPVQELTNDYLNGFVVEIVK